MNCQQHPRICNQALIQYFPTVRLYPTKKQISKRRISSSLWEGIAIQFPSQSSIGQLADIIRDLLLTLMIVNDDYVDKDGDIKGDSILVRDEL